MTDQSNAHQLSTGENFLVLLGAAIVRRPPHVLLKEVGLMGVIQVIRDFLSGVVDAGKLPSSAAEPFARALEHMPSNEPALRDQIRHLEDENRYLKIKTTPESPAERWSVTAAIVVANFMSGFLATIFVTSVWQTL